ncbi:MAG: hypothetical protein IPG38_13010 [Chitinophagaceae bacterium]|nr:hypothetical protein [Chitinophagaceae bacterium]
MKNKFSLYLNFIGAGILVLIMSCKHDIPVPEINVPVSGGTQTCSTDTVYFQNKVLPLLNSGCAMSGCHDAITHKEGVNLTTYAKILSTGGVQPGNPAGSELYKVLNETGGDRMPPPPAAAFTQAQKTLFINGYCKVHKIMPVTIVILPYLPIRLLLLR